MELDVQENVILLDVFNVTTPLFVITVDQTLAFPAAKPTVSVIVDFSFNPALVLLAQLDAPPALVLTLALNAHQVIGSIKIPITVFSSKV